MRNLLFLSLLLPGLVFAGVVGLNNRANTEYRKGRFDRALKLYTEAMKPKHLRARRGPEDAAVVHYNAGNALASAGALDKAVEAYAFAHRAKDPKVRAAAHYGTGWARMQSGEYQEALESFIEVLRIDPSDQDAKKNIEYIRRQMKAQKDPNQKQNKDKNKDDDGKKDGSKESESGEDGQEEKSGRAKKDGEGKKEGEPRPQEYKQVPGGMTKEQAEQVLNALAAQERQNLEENKRKMFGAGGYRYVEKDW